VISEYLATALAVVALLGGGGIGFAIGVVMEREYLRRKHGGRR